MNRRHCLRLLATALSAGGPVATLAATRAPAAGLTLSIGTYSLKPMPLDDAITLVAGIGYDGIELATQTGSTAEPSKLSPARRAEIRRRLDGLGLVLTALMEQLTPSASDQEHRAQVDRLKRAFDLSRELAPDRPPLVQTVLGGGTWAQKHPLYRDRLADWQEAAKECQVVLAIKPHRSGAMSQPAEAVSLIRELGDSPWLRMVYDYSHYAFRDLSVEDTVRTALPYTAHLVVKDAVAQGKSIGFTLPGSTHTFDYPALLRLFLAGGYHGDVCCEVSSMVSGKREYDPAATARTCYENMSREFAEGQIARPARPGKRPSPPT